MSRIKKQKENWRRYCGETKIEKTIYVMKTLEHVKWHAEIRTDDRSTKTYGRWSSLEGMPFTISRL
jgi:hypothetical protein